MGLAMKVLQSVRKGRGRMRMVGGIRAKPTGWSWTEAKSLCRRLTSLAV